MTSKERRTLLAEVSLLLNESAASVFDLAEGLHADEFAIRNVLISMIARGDVEASALRVPSNELIFGKTVHGNYHQRVVGVNCKSCRRRAARMS